LRHIQYRRTANRRAIATLAIFRPRRIVRWKYLLRHSGTLRTATWAASTSRNRRIELPCLVMCPSRRRFPLESLRAQTHTLCRLNAPPHSRLTLSIATLGVPSFPHPFANPARQTQGPESPEQSAEVKSQPQQERLILPPASPGVLIYCEILRAIKYGHNCLARSGL
jgi:hypothetical protein